MTYLTMHLNDRLRSKSKQLTWRFSRLNMSVKKLLNSPEKCVDDSLYGLWRSYPNLALHSAERTLFHTVVNGRQRNAVLSGGGSGHEPFPSGYVGEGMLTASVSGSIFASPPKRQILHAIRKLSETYEGVFLVIPNYTGDRLNFGLAMETADKQRIKVESIIVGEDIAQTAYGMENKSGRRGMCGLILVLKIAGYLAKEGKSLEEIKEKTKRVTEQLASIGVCLEACSIPGSGLLFSLDQDEMEFGVGVHGEAGTSRMKMKSAKETVEILLQPLVRHLKLEENDEIIALVNNLGCLSQIEQWIIAGELEKQITRKRIKLRRMYAGPLFTSLNMAGVQICLMKLSPDMEELLLQGLDDATSAPAWPGSTLSTVAANPTFAKEMSYSEVKTPFGGRLTDAQSKLVEQCLIEGSNIVIENEEKLNFLDSGCGDGDCGTTMARLAKEILDSIREKKLVLYHPAQMFSQLGEIAEGDMGGTIGAIYGLLLSGASHVFSLSVSVGDPVIWGEAWAAGITLIKKYSNARIGDRTLMDALEPGCQAFQQHLEIYGTGSGVRAFGAAVESAEIGCSTTRHMKAAVGRASYVGISRLKEVDAGAFGVTLWLRAFHRVIAPQQKVT